MWGKHRLESKKGSLLKIQIPFMKCKCIPQSCKELNAKLEKLQKSFFATYRQTIDLPKEEKIIGLSISKKNKHCISFKCFEYIKIKLQRIYVN